MYHQSYAQFIEDFDSKKYVNPYPQDEDDISSLAIYAMKQWRLNKDPRVKKWLDEVQDDKFEGFQKALLNEAKLITLIDKKKLSLDQIHLAEKTLQIYPDAAISKIILAYAVTLLGNPVKSVQYLLEINKAYPEADWVYNSICEYLIFAKEYKKAFPYIRKIKKLDIRLLFFIAFRIIKPFGLVLYLTYFTLIFLEKGWFILPLLIFLLLISLYASLRAHTRLAYFYFRHFLILIVSTSSIWSIVATSFL